MNEIKKKKCPHCNGLGHVYTYNSLAERMRELEATSSVDMIREEATMNEAIASAELAGAKIPKKEP